MTKKLYIMSPDSENGVLKGSTAIFLDDGTQLSNVDKLSIIAEAGEPTKVEIRLTAIDVVFIDHPSQIK